MIFSLELGDFLPDMAGASVFRAARSHGQLSALTAVQSTLSRMSSGLIARLLAHGCSSQESALITSPPICQALHEGLTKLKGIYLREVPAYVRPWASHLRYVQCPVMLIHGQQDTWAPLTMAQVLKNALPDAQLEILDTAGHFGALRHVLSAIQNDGHSPDPKFPQ
jgi:pimeloyl-ACP methyl ester carboxylesterase